MTTQITINDDNETINYKLNFEKHFYFMQVSLERRNDTGKVRVFGAEVHGE